MKKIVVSLGLAVSLFSAEELMVKDGEANIYLNGKQKNLKQNEKLELADCDSVKFISGNGTIKIKNIAISTATKQKEYKTKCPDGFFSSIAATLLASNEQTRYGVSLRGNGEKLADSYEISMPTGADKIVEKEFIATKEYLIIQSKRFYPLPVMLEIKDVNGAIIYSASNNSEPKTLFKIDSSVFTVNSTLIVSSVRTGEILFKIHVK